MDDGKVNNRIFIEISLKGREMEAPRRFVLHTLYLYPQTPFPQTEFEKYYSIGTKDQFINRINVVSGTTLEITVAQFWSSLGTSKVRNSQVEK